MKDRSYDMLLAGPYCYTQWLYGYWQWRKTRCLEKNLLHMICGCTRVSS